MKRYKGVLGHDPGSRLPDGTQEEIVSWDTMKDAAATTKFYYELLAIGCDTPIVHAKLKTGEYVLGDGHSRLCGKIVTEKEFRASLEELQQSVNNYLYPIRTILKLMTKE